MEEKNNSICCPWFASTNQPKSVMVYPKFRLSSNEIWRKLLFHLQIFSVVRVFAFHDNILVWENSHLLIDSQRQAISCLSLMFLLRMLWSAPIKTHYYASHSTWPEATMLSQIIHSPLTDFNLTNNSSRAFMVACKTGKRRMSKVLKSISCLFYYYILWGLMYSFLKSWDLLTFSCFNFNLITINDNREYKNTEICLLNFNSTHIFEIMMLNIL